MITKAANDYQKIKKFLLRLTHGENFRSSERWKDFIEMSFYEYLYEVGMFETADWKDGEAQKKARFRYLTALRSILTYYEQC